MKKHILFYLTLILLISPLSYCFADDSAEENHICFMRVDADQDGWATLQEFEKFYKGDSEKLQKMDQDNDGKVSHDEYEEYLYNQKE